MSTYDQLSKVLRKYRQTIDERRALEVEQTNEWQPFTPAFAPRTTSTTTTTTTTVKPDIDKKPIVFPLKPTFADIIMLLEEHYKEKRRISNEAEAEERSDQVTQEADGENQPFIILKFL